MSRLENVPTKPIKDKSEEFEKLEVPATDNQEEATNKKNNTANKIAVEFEEFTKKKKPPKTKQNVLLSLDIEVVKELDKIKKNTGRSRNEIANDILKRVLHSMKK